MDVRRRTRGSASLPRWRCVHFSRSDGRFNNCAHYVLHESTGANGVSEIILMTVGGAQNALAYLFESGLPASKKL
jgi:hypothetical protein